MLNRIKKKIRREIWNHRLLSRPTRQELEYIADLRDRFRRLSMSQKSTRQIASLWAQYVSMLHQNVQAKDPRRFLQWKFIVLTMVHDADPCEFAEIRNREDWSEWESALIENSAVRPYPYLLYPRTSGNAVHLAYSLSKFISATKCNLEKLSGILEFGGGYGGMARIIHNLKFQGSYTIFDLPEFLLLQRFFLSMQNVKCALEEERSDCKAPIRLISSVQGLNQELGAMEDSLALIATWSLSEVPLDLRSEFLSAIPAPQYFLFGYQEHWEQIDNIAYFRTLKNKYPNYLWIDEPVAHLPGNHYLFGKRM